MPKQKTRRILIDASVATAAGETSAPLSVTCRKFLTEFKKSSNVVVLYSELQSEWADHPSSFAMDWLAAMVAKKHFHFIQLEEHAALQQACTQANLSQQEHRAWRKDFHLICASLQTDRSISSRDRKAESVFCKIAATFGPLAKIEWFDPERDEAHLDAWLKNINAQKGRFRLSTPTSIP